MNAMLLLIANILLYIILLLVNILFKHSFDTKIENIRLDSAKAIDLFRNELFRKSRRVELKYDIYKGFSWSFSQVHWLITRIDWGKVLESFENLQYQVSLVSNFYGEEVKTKLNELGTKLTKIAEKRTVLDLELQKISWEKEEVEQKKKYLNIISGQEAKSFEEIYERITIETDIKTKNKSIFEKQTRLIFQIIKDMQVSLKEVTTIGDQVLVLMASEIKIEY